MTLAEIDPATWAELNRLLDVALDLDPSERDAFVASLGPEHAPLAPQLSLLIARLPRTGAAPLSLPRIGTGAPETPGPARGPAVAPGTEVGPYRLLAVLGEGGMGTVWRAERADGLVPRPVALKLPRGPLGTGLAERMAREREILAGLAHPGIARLYDAGVTVEGQPYLALELVDGVPVDRHAREAGLDLRARLRLFILVVKAVAHAHGRLVVHRDLKPSNVLVGADGQPKLLDFGIARLLLGGAAGTSTLTEPGGRALTLAYASPEQVAGRPIGAASDIYSLGVVLFELVCGARPYGVEPCDRDRLERAILEDEPRRASEAATDPGFRLALRGDLDAIIGRALRKDPDDRYPTADALAEDLERHLSGLPVRARPASTGYRLGKFVRRNWIAVGAGSVTLAGVVLGAGVAAWQARVARAEQRRAEEVSGFIASIFREADPYHLGKPVSAAELLDRARARIDGGLAGGPELRVELKVILGRSLLDLRSVEVADQVVSEALAEARATLGAGHPQALKARVLQNEIDRMRGRNERIAEGLDDLVEALRVAGPALFDELNLTLRHRAGLAIRARPAEAVAFAREALAHARSRGGDADPLGPECAIMLSLALGYGGDPRAALEAAELAVALASGLHPDRRHPITMDARGTLARARAAAGDHEGAASMQAELVGDSEAVLGSGHRMVGIWRAGLSLEQILLGELDEALENAKRAVEILAAFDPAGSEFVHAARQRPLALARLALRRDEAALPDLSLVARAFDATMGPTNERSLQAHVQRALALGRLGRFDEADDELRGPLAAPSHAPTFHPLHVSGVVRRLAGDSRAALRLQGEALERTAEGDADARERDRMVILKELGILDVERGAYREAIARLEEAIALFERRQHKVTPERAEALLALGRARWQLTGPAHALPHLEAADALWRGLAPRSTWAREAALWLGRCRAALGLEESRASLAPRR